MSERILSEVVAFADLKLLLQEAIKNPRPVGNITNIILFRVTFICQRNRQWNTKAQNMICGIVEKIL